MSESGVLSLPAAGNMLAFLADVVADLALEALDRAKVVIAGTPVPLRAFHDVTITDQVITKSEPLHTEWVVYREWTAGEVAAWLMMMLLDPKHAAVFKLTIANCTFLPDYTTEQAQAWCLKHYADA